MYNRDHPDSLDNQAGVKELVMSLGHDGNRRLNHDRERRCMLTPSDHKSQCTGRHGLCVTVHQERRRPEGMMGLLYDMAVRVGLRATYDRVV